MVLTFPLEPECTTDCARTYTQQYGHSSGWDDNRDDTDILVISTFGSSICISERTTESESAPVHQLIYIILAQEKKSDSFPLYCLPLEMKTVLGEK